MNRIPGAIALMSFALLLAACESTPVAEPSAGAPVESRTVPPAGSGGAAAGAMPGGATASGTPQSQVASVDVARGGSAAAAAGAGAALAAPAQRIVYFDFDSFVIRDEFKPLIDGHAKVLTAQRGRKLVVEGHTDERGSREYNLALGQKRADAVVRSLTLLGVQQGQVEAVSFGEERPAATASDEAAWAKNRRAELKDR
jgi:peptidoglycan-associated lipoprotein